MILLLQDNKNRRHVHLEEIFPLYYVGPTTTQNRDVCTIRSCDDIVNIEIGADPETTDVIPDQSFDYTIKILKRLGK